MSEWISVEDRLPTVANEYIVTNGSAVSTLEWNDGKWWSVVLGQNVPLKNITHWMPLPELPK